MKRFLVLSALVCSLLIVAAFLLPSGEGVTGATGQATVALTPSATRRGYTNYSGYYRIRCWPGCHTRNLPESIKRAARTADKPTPQATKRGYTNYSGYYRMRCWPGCHTKNLPESIRATQKIPTAIPQAMKRGYTNYSGYYRMRCWPGCHTKDIPESIRSRY